MSDLISRQAVIVALTDTLQYEGMVMDELISVVANIPAADVEPVTWCKDCRYSYIFEPWECDATRYCKELKNHWGNTPLCVNDDDYCSRAWRIEDE